MLAALLASVMALSVFAADSFLSEANQNGLRFDYTGNLGYEFTLNHSITVTALGRPENLEDGGMQYEHTLYIWDVETEALLASVVVTPETPIDDLGFHTAQLETPVTLFGGKNYIITSTEEAGGDCWYDIGRGPDDVALAVTDIATIKISRFAGSMDAFPSNSNGNADVNDGYVGPTFYYELSDAKAPERELVYVAKDAPISFLTEANQGGRNDYGGDVGYQVQPKQDLVITALGRPANKDFGGMNQEHPLYIWDSETQEAVVAVTVKPDSPIDELGFHVVQLEQEVTLKEGVVYYVVSTEYKDGDCWYDVDNLAKTPKDGIALVPTELDLAKIVGCRHTGTNGAFPTSGGGTQDKNDGYVGVTFYFYTAAQQEVVEEPVVETPVVEEPVVEEPVVEEPVVEEPVVEEPAAEETVEAPAETTAPQTSDSMILVLAMIAMVGIGAVVSKKIRA